MNLKHLINTIELNPKRLFLIDGLGAILSAFFLGVVLVKFETIFGVPVAVLHFLAIIPLIFLIYDIYSYRKGHLKIGFLLKGIAVLNLIYCCISIGLIVYHFNTVKMLGWAYILIEITIIILIATFEFNLGLKITKSNS